MIGERIVWDKNVYFYRFGVILRFRIVKIVNYNWMVIMFYEVY